jgi:alkanesulfonate monooxygenase SsuD/methylene tetrahydromethanopterin reductase-like flavin-dependent oxidoreductase (luciferase family)
MKFGLMYSFVVQPGSSISHLDTFREMDGLIPLAEELGFEAFHTTEHHFQDIGWLANPLLVLAKAAGMTKTMKLVSNIMIVPLYDPLHLVEDVATLDNLCDGRLILGVSPGYVSEEFSGFQVPYEERFKRFEEVLDILQASWEGDTLSYDGQFYQIPEVPVVPKPVQKKIPIWYGVSGPKLLERAARRRCPVTASPRHTATEIQEHFERYDKVCAEVGYEPEEKSIIREVFVAPTTEEAEALAGPACNQMFSLYGRKSAEGQRDLRNDQGQLIKDESEVDFRSFKSRYIIGSPDEARRQMQVLIDQLGPTEVVCRMQLPGIPTKDLETSIRLFGEEVMPAFK